MTDYRKLRINNLASPQFRHILLFIYWLIYGATFVSLENFFHLNYHTVEVAFDRKIPFCEFFIFPYYFWFLFIIGIHIYTFFLDVPAFKKMMYFIIITYTVTTVIYFVYPTKQELRPTEFLRDNVCVDIVKFLYQFDTNTNVCPSLHVIGSFSVLFTTWQCKRFRNFKSQFVLVTITLLISISTVFLKQHSIIDMFAGLALSIAAYPLAYILPDKLSKRKSNIKKNE